MQHECIPQAILGMDVICQAKSGMGKTAVFVISTLQQLEPVDGQVGGQQPPQPAACRQQPACGLYRYGTTCGVAAMRSLDAGAVVD